jgi:hypothetical protein
MINTVLEQVEAHHLEAVMAEIESSHGGIPKVFQALAWQF